MTAQGRLVPIDLKNMRYPVAQKDIPEHGQLGVYQLLLREGGMADGEAGADAAPRAVEVGGAALVQLRVDAGKGSGDPKVQFQEALGSDEPTWVEVKLGDAAHIVRTEAFVASPGPACSYCAYKSACPAKAQGEQVLS